MFGAGGGALQIQTTSPHASAGSAIGGQVVFMGGKRPQNVTAITLRLTLEERRMQMTNQGMQPQSHSRELVPATPIAAAFTSTPGQPTTFPFQLPIPAGVPSSTKDVVTYHLRASADIDGEIDPGTALEIQIVGEPVAVTGPADVAIANGTRVLARWTDGQRHEGVVRAFQNGAYQIDWTDPRLGASSWVYPQELQVMGANVHPGAAPTGAKPMATHAQQQGAIGAKPMAAHTQGAPAKPMATHTQQQGAPAKPIAQGMPGKGMHPKDLHAASLGSVGDPPSIGSTVMAQHPNNHQWYPGRVVAMQSGMVGVDWDDPNLGQSSWVSPTAVRPR